MNEFDLGFGFGIGIEIEIELGGLGLWVSLIIYFDSWVVLLALGLRKGME